MTGSLAYRRNEAAILRGDVPEKYLRILPYVPAGPVIEMGAAEGVLALLLAREGRSVTALEKNRDRHDAARRLAAAWDVEAEMICGDIGERLDLLDGKDVFVAVRAIYYLRHRIDDIFAEIAARVPHVVLCGNRGRAERYHAGRPDAPLGEYNFYASRQGMRALVERHGYRVTDELVDGDAIVVGAR